MKVEEITSKTLEARMHVADRADGNVARAQADSFKAAAAAPVVPAVLEQAAGTPAELSEKGRIIRTVA